MAGSGRGVFLLFPQYRKGSLFLIALPFLETTVGILGAPRGSARSWGHGAHVLRSSFLASCTPLHNFRYGIEFESFRRSCAMNAVSPFAITDNRTLSRYGSIALGSIATT